MEIRNATNGDISEIVALLKLSLGENLMPKSETFWRWKHIDNPFGKSPVLLAFEKEQLIGVRAFMRWEWKRDSTVFKAVRAVDTATHPDYQGKGIFKKLTLQLVDQSRKEGVDFIFNTPNKSSKPGYLKMGWSEFGRMPISIRPLISFGKKASDIGSRYRIDSSSMTAWMAQKGPGVDNGNLVTNGSSSFLQWRYVDNPNVTYHSFFDITYIVIFRLKPGRFGTELRICDFQRTSTFDRKSFRSQLVKVAKELGATFITWSGHLLHLSSLNLKLGPVITVHPLSSNNSLSFDFWKPTLGDLEVF